MLKVVLAIGFLFCATCGDAFIVPQEIPSLLSLVYSNIPPIKKGTDSRIGFGYRLGDHADIQVQFEIGPQKETKAIGVSSNKRSVNPDDQMIAKNKVVQIQRESWLQSWFDRSKEKHFEETATVKDNETTMISEKALQELQKLYRSTTEDLSNANNTQ